MKPDANRILPLDHPDLPAHLTELAISGEFGHRDWHDVADFEDMPLLLPANDNDRTPKRCPPHDDRSIARALDTKRKHVRLVKDHLRDAAKPGTVLG